jgi:hypothetical protein
MVLYEEQSFAWKQGALVDVDESLSRRRRLSELRLLFGELCMRRGCERRLKPAAGCWLRAPSAISSRMLRHDDG